jgi:hypothetical protein
MIRIGVRSFVAGGPYTPSDADALAFVNAAEITNETQKLAINNLVTDLKGYGIWTKMKAIYPFCGGTASSHKWNLKDPRDLDAAFRLVFFGGWTHSSNGALPNGTNAYSNTNLNPLANLINNNYSVSYYSRTNTNLLNAVEIGSSTGSTGNPQISISLYYAGSSQKGFVSGYYPNYYIGSSNNDTLGLMTGTRTASNSAKMYMDGVQVGSTLTTVYSGVLQNTSLFLGSNKYQNSAVEFSSKQCAFASIGDGLTDTEAANFYTAVQAYQTTLSRNV